MAGILDELTEEELNAIANGLEGELADSGELFDEESWRKGKNKQSGNPREAMKQIMETIGNMSDKPEPKSRYSGIESEAEKKSKYGEIPESYIDGPKLYPEDASDSNFEPSESEALLEQFTSVDAPVVKEKVAVKPIGKKGVEVQKTKIAAKPANEKPLTPIHVPEKKKADKPAEKKGDGRFKLPSEYDVKAPVHVPMNYSEKAKSAKERILDEGGVEQSGTDFLPGGEGESVGSLLAQIAAGYAGGKALQGVGKGISSLLGRGTSEAAPVMSKMLGRSERPNMMDADFTNVGPNMLGGGERKLLNMGKPPKPTYFPDTIKKPTNIPNTTSRFNDILKQATGSEKDPFQAVNFAGNKTLMNPTGGTTPPMHPLAKSKAEAAIRSIGDRIKKGTLRKDAVVIQLDKLGLSPEIISEITSKMGAEPIRSILGR